MEHFDGETVENFLTNNLNIQESEIKDIFT